MVESTGRQTETVHIGKERCNVLWRGEERIVKHYIKSSSHQFHHCLIGGYFEEQCQQYLSTTYLQRHCITGDLQTADSSRNRWRYRYKLVNDLRLATIPSSFTEDTGLGCMTPYSSYTYKTKKQAKEFLIWESWTMKQLSNFSYNPENLIVHTWIQVKISTPFEVSGTEWVAPHPFTGFCLNSCLAEIRGQNYLITSISFCSVMSLEINYATFTGLVPKRLSRAIIVVIKKKKKVLL